jgi:hypothetical protein
MHGVAAGPIDGTCTSGWVTDHTTCITGDVPSGCGLATNCADCTYGYNCGWCGATGMCVPGADMGPTNGTCASGWAWYQSDCPATTWPAHCADHTDCDSCTTDNEHCGWCGASGTCLAGVDTGPINATCTGGWSRFWSACAVLGDAGH